MATGTKDDPWQLTTAPGTSQYAMYRDGDELVCQVGSTQLRYQGRAIEDLAAWLKEQGTWVPLGAADEQKPAAEGTVEAWGRSESNPVGGWYGLRKGVPRPVRHVPAPAAGAARARRADPRGPQQQRARAVGRPQLSRCRYVMSSDRLWMLSFP